MNHDMSRSAIEDGPDVGDCDGETGDKCCHCAGTGYFSETVEGSDGRDVDVDYDCRHCDTTGLEP